MGEPIEGVPAETNRWIHFGTALPADSEAPLGPLSDKEIKIWYRRVGKPRNVMALIQKYISNKKKKEWNGKKERETGR